VVSMKERLKCPSGRGLTTKARHYGGAVQVAVAMKEQLKWPWL
jgi:hypothetical protein